MSHYDGSWINQAVSSSAEQSLDNPPVLGFGLSRKRSMTVGDLRYQRPAPRTPLWLTASAPRRMPAKIDENIPLMDQSEGKIENSSNVFLDTNMGQGVAGSRLGMSDFTTTLDSRHIHNDKMYKLLERANLAFLYETRHQIKITVFTLLGTLAALFFMVPEDGQLTKTLVVIENDLMPVIDRGFPVNSGEKYRVDFTIGGYINSSTLDISDDKPQIQLALCDYAYQDLDPFQNHSCYGKKTFAITKNADLATVEWNQKLNNNFDKTYLVVTMNNSDHAVSVAVDFILVDKFAKAEIAVASIILVILYGLIITEIFHRTVAAMLASTLSLGALTVMGKGPDLETVIGWIDWETLMLLFGMMILVAIFAESGFFDYISLLAYKVAKGQQWPLVYLLCAFTGLISAFLDNVTTILLMTPVTINLCEVLNMDAKWVLIAEVLISNIGGTATGIGDPPNVLIVSDSDLTDRGVNFMEFSVHMLLGSTMACFAAMGFIRFLYRNKQICLVDDPQIRAWEKELKMWRRTMARIGAVCREEKAVKGMLLDHMRNLHAHIEQYRENKHKTAYDWEANYHELSTTYIIRDPILLAKSGIVLLVVVAMFFMQSTSALHTELGWIAMLAAIVLLLLTDLEDVEDVLHKVEYSTLLFFAALFVLMEGLAEMGLITAIGDVTESFVKVFPDDAQFACAIIIIVWVSALVSSFLDNIPFTEAMIPVIVSLSESNSNLLLKPLVYALAFGACLGGNGTLIGASANVVCAGIAEQKGNKISFGHFFQVGFPVMLVTTFIAMCYLLFCHVLCSWGNT